MKKFTHHQVKYQHDEFMRQVYITVDIALSRVFPVLLTGDPSEDLNNYKPVVQAVGQLTSLGFQSRR